MIKILKRYITTMLFDVKCNDCSSFKNLTTADIVIVLVCESIDLLMLKASNLAES